MKRMITAFLIVGAFPASAAAQQPTVYSSLPLSGASRVQTKAVNDGARRTGLPASRSARRAPSLTALVCTRDAPLRGRLE